ncbi:uncharacterized protein LOC141657967 [Silene latifolia]|uniref:uncharacterized protein LOC141657967 n=1 Tax=Silene latifolia TaxID=37657 RepID=UPI003D777A24
MRRVREKIDGYYGIDVDSAGRSGGLAFMWKKEIDCSFVSASLHHMDFHIREGGKEWRVTGFYGWPSVTDRHLSWDLLRLLYGQSSLPWICIGDFNEVLFSTEMKGGSRAQWQMNNFQAAVDFCGLKDVAWEGYAFTYDNGQAGDNNRQCMIDRAMCTEAWLDLFPYAKNFHLDREWSDHAPLKLIFDRREIGGKTRSRFRFEQVWVGEEGCEEAVCRGVEKGRGNLPATIQACAKELLAWKKISIGKINRALETKRRQLTRLNEGDRTDAAVQKRRKLIAEIANLYKQEEQYWRQRSRALWLKDGDRNTKFFHSKAGERRSKNFIPLLIDDQGRECRGNEEVERVAVQYFEELFRTSEPNNFNDVLIGLEGRVTERMNQMLRMEFREEEIVEALNQMHPLKAPGPDGMNGLFFQTYWNEIGPQVIPAVLDILRGNASPACLNKTNIVLIPKKKAPDKIRDFRPISLCNVAYKLVSKVLANRLKLFLGEIVSENQSAFTPGRLITDNILMAFEMFHFMKNNRQSDGYMALKLDMAKAYDRVEWVFLRQVLLTMGFDTGWVQRVMACVTTVTFSVLVNGSPSVEFRPSRGLRQGDPLSPYLFLLCAEALSNMLRRAVENQTIHGIQIAATAPVISHLLFADDSIFFVRATTQEADAVNDILRSYEAASGQLVSLEKTTVVYSRGVTQGQRDAVTARLGVGEVGEHGRYLGLPTVIGRSKKVLTDIIRDKLSKRLQGWRGKILSRAGKEVLIKAVANSLPTYVMSVFKIPANFCDELRAIVARFWWGHDESKRGIHWVSWRKMARPKGEGGMGFRDFRQFNLALLGKQAWRLLTDPTSLWARLMKAKYYPHDDFMTAGIGYNPSYTWRGIVEAKGVMERGLRRRIGDGTETRVWGQAWLPLTHTGRIISPCPQGLESMCVAELMMPNAAEWDEDKLNQTLLPIDIQRVRDIRISPNKPPDIWYWGGEKDGLYSVRSAYKTEALATRANIAARVGGEFSFCPFCLSNLESSLHLFRDCGVAKWVWDGLGLGELTKGRGADVKEWVEGCWKEMCMEEGAKLMVGCWAIWEHRNKVIFDNAAVAPEDVVRRAKDVIHEGAGIGNGRPNGGGHERGGDQREEETGWRPAQEGFVKINVDAGVKEGEGVSTGVVCRDTHGHVIWGVSIGRDQCWEVPFAEATAIMDGLEEAAVRGIRKVEVESDCLSVIEAIRGKQLGRSMFHQLLNDIVMFSSNFESVVWSYASRVNNCVAHGLAHIVPRVVGKVVWEDGLPPSVNTAVAFDRLLI